MKKLFLLILILAGIKSIAQPPTNYTNYNQQTRQKSIMLDSGLHIPSYSGTPAGRRVGVSVHDGAIAVDTINHRFYIYSNGGWIRQASFSEATGGGTFVDSVKVRSDSLFYYIGGVEYLTASYLRVQRFLDSMTNHWAAIQSKAPLTRNINTGYGLTGGGNLSADRTLVFDSATVFPQVRATVPVPGWQQVFDREISGSLMTKIDTAIFSENKTLKFQYPTTSDGSYEIDFGNKYAQSLGIKFKHNLPYTAGCTSCGLNSMFFQWYQGDTLLNTMGAHNGPNDKHFFLADMNDAIGGSGIPANRFLTVEKNGTDYFAWYNLPDANSPITISGGTYPAYLHFNSSHDTLARYGFGVSTKNFFVLDTSFFNTAVGIGTRYPSALLDVRADASINGLTIGRGALSSQYNTALGYQAGNTSSNAAYVENTAVGYNAQKTVKAIGFTGIGAYAGFNGGSWESVAIGKYAMYNYSSNDVYSTEGNVAVGSRSGYNMNAGAINNTLVGYGSGHSVTTGYNNTYVGINANGAGIFGVGTAGNTSQQNIGIGYNAQFYSKTGDGNVSIGGNTFSNTGFTGAYNTALGYGAGSAHTTGSYNVYVGGNTGSSFATKSKWMVLSDGFGNVKIVADSVGNVGIGTSTPFSILHTVGTVRHASLGTASSDTTTNKPLGINSSGDIIPMNYWPGSGGGGSGWALTGNSISSGIGDFFGSTNNRSVLVKTNNVKIATWDSTGQLAIGASPSPSILGANDSKLYVNGTIGFDYAGLKGYWGYAGGDAFLVMRNASTVDINRIHTNGDSYFTGGNVGIGDNSPASLLTVGSGDKFQVNTNGNIVKLNNVTTSFPGSNSSGVLTNDGSGNLSWDAGVTYYAPSVLSANSSDADYTAVVNSIKKLPAATLTANRTITIPAGANGDKIEIWNMESGFTWNLTGATVYLADQTTVITSLLYNVPTLMTKIDGKWTIQN
jgi:hypothetical protein